MSTSPVVADAAVIKRLAWLDLSGVQQRFAHGEGTKLDDDVVSTVGLEYRRFLFLRMMHPDLDIVPPPLIDTYWRLHAADRAAFDANCAALTLATASSADRLVPPSDPVDGTADATVRELYAATFPCGNADLWGWPDLMPGHRNSSPDLGLVHRRLASVIDDSTRARLLTEAHQRRSTITEGHSDGYFCNRRGAIKSPRHQCWATPGQVLLDVHWSDAIPRLIASDIGVIVVPTMAAYLYYRRGHFIGIHTDNYPFELTLLTLLSGAVEPLDCHLHLADASLQEIKTLAETAGGLPAGGTSFEINTESFLLSGHRIPHQRGRRDRDEETIVLSQNYAVLVP
ncbi:MAG TPA: hypothetical protein VJT72_04845 [Pseudonocardiaceae bacterium]|nr:hypothetical protein [Pseudonocardiaceae bacterium]